MKQIFSLFFCCVLLLLTLSSCAEKTDAPATLTAKPLFRLTLPQGAGEKMRTWFFPQSSGFLYLHPTEDGFSGGFVSPLRSISSEAIIDGTGDLKDVVAWETASDRAIIASPDFLAPTLLNEGSSSVSELPERFGVEEVYPFDATSFLAKHGSLLLKIPANLEDAFVLADTGALPDFVKPVAISDGGKKIYYATGKDGAFDGIAFFEYGKNLPLGTQSFSFDAVQTLPGGAILMQNDTSFTFLDPESDLRRDIRLTGAVRGATASPSGALLVTLEHTDAGDSFSVYDFATGAQRATIPLPDAVACPQFSLSERTLFFAVDTGDGLIFHTADLSEIL